MNKLDEGNLQKLIANIMYESHKVIIVSLNTPVKVSSVQ